MTFELQILTFSGNSHAISADVEWTFKEVKEEIVSSGFSQAPVTNQRLLFEEHHLKDADKLKDVLPKGKDVYDLFLVISKDETKLDLLSAVSVPGNSWSALERADACYQDDPEVVLAAARTNSFSITLASARLLNDKDFLRQAMRGNPFVEDHIPKEMVILAKASVSPKQVETECGEELLLKQSAHVVNESQRKCQNSGSNRCAFLRNTYWFYGARR
jgi:hypothetical protein